MENRHNFQATYESKLSKIKQLSNSNSSGSLFRGTRSTSRGVTSGTTSSSGNSSHFMINNNSVIKKSSSTSNIRY